MTKVFVYCLIQEQVSVSLKVCVELQAELHAQPSTVYVLCASYAAARVSNTVTLPACVKRDCIAAAGHLCTCAQAVMYRNIDRCWCFVQAVSCFWCSVHLVTTGSVRMTSLSTKLAVKC